MSDVPNRADGINVAVVGATGAVGRDLPDRPGAGEPACCIASGLFASASSNGEVIEVRERAHRVRSLPENDGVGAMFEGIDLVFTAAPAEVVRPLIPVLQDLDIPVVDIGGTMADRSPLMVPGSAWPPSRTFRIPASCVRRRSSGVDHSQPALRSRSSRRSWDCDVVCEQRRKGRAGGAFWSGRLAVQREDSAARSVREPVLPLM